MAAELRECAFCGKPIDPKERHNIQVQVVFAGWKVYGDGHVMRKDPGKVIYWHGICGVPKEVPDAG